MTIAPNSLAVNKNDHAVIAGVDVKDLVEQYGTPLYVMDYQTIRDRCHLYTDALSEHYPNYLLVYAGKANLNTGLLNIIADQGLGVDVVSGGELYTALRTKIDPKSILFHGNNKSDQELQEAIEADVRIVVDHLGEARQIAKIAKRLDRVARVLFRIKPGIVAETHTHIMTGHESSKFGIDRESLTDVIRLCLESSHIDILGVHGHIGSQLLDTAPYEALVNFLVGKMAELRHEYGIDVTELNIGGGIGIRYDEDDDMPSIPDFIQSISRWVKAACQEHNIPEPLLILEPGRSIVGQAGVTLYQIGAIKELPDSTVYYFVDGGMADNPRPIMYQAKHTMVLANKMSAVSDRQVSVAGKFCESGDILAHQTELPAAQVGDLLMVYATGAYNYAMASNYNRFCRPAMVLAKDGSSKVLVRRETYEDLIRYDA